MFLPVHTALPLAQAGQIRMLALGSAERAASTPDLPTLAEAGFPGVQADLWYGLLGPAGLPAPLVARLNGILSDWIGDPATAEVLRAQGMVPTPCHAGCLRRVDRRRPRPLGPRDPGGADHRGMMGLGMPA
jgi:tripartite-type tricarboxylate transporter receptor subunit TctC